MSGRERACGVGPQRRPETQAQGAQGVLNEQLACEAISQVGGPFPTWPGAPCTLTSPRAAQPLLGTDQVETPET